MNRRLLRAGIAGVLVAGLALLGTTAAMADPVPGTPGTPPDGKTPSQIYAAVGADAFAELTNNITTHFNATTPPEVLASYDAINPVTSAAGETIVTKPGCSLVRPNGANAGVTAMTLNQKSTVDTNELLHRLRALEPGEGQLPLRQSLTFYAQSRDAVSYAVIGNAYAPTTPLTTTQLKDIFECTTDDWSEVGGQAGEIHVYLPPASAATLTFFLQALGTNLNNVNAGCAGLPRVFAQQQNDGRSLNGDPQGIAPYAVTKWAAQANGAVGHRRLPRWGPHRTGERPDCSDHQHHARPGRPTRC